MVAYVVVIGSAGIDIQAKPSGELRYDTSNFGAVRNAVGGVARNIAENLGKLEIDTYLLTAVGKDMSGTRVIRRSRSGGVDCAHVLRVPGTRTPNFVSILSDDDSVLMTITDIDAMKHVDADYLLAHESLIAHADMVVIDCTLDDATMSAIFDIAEHHDVRVCADPTSPTLADRLCPYLPQLYMIAPNAAETSALCGLEAPAHDRDTALEAARSLVTMGVEIAVVTMGEQGVAYADSNGSGFIRAIHTKVIDSTGAGDAFSAAVIFGLLNEVPVDEAMRLGMTAASLTISSTETVVPDLSQELLYSKLVV